MICGKVESVKLIEHKADKLDLCKITIDFDEIFIWGDYNELIDYIGKPVEYSVRQDVIDGKPVTVIANMANQYTVQTLSKQESIKLIPASGLGRAECTFDVSTLKYGDTAYGQVMLLSGYTAGKSDKTKWIDCTVIDKYSKLVTVRIFTKEVEGDIDAEATIAALVGYYIKSDITFTKYGYQTRGIELVNVPVVKAPEVDIATNVLVNEISKDTELQEYCNAYDLIYILSEHINIELGYELVYMAAEIALINELENMTDTYDFKAMRRAVFATRGYLLPSKTKFSKAVLNINKLSKTSLKTDKELLLLLDPLADEEPSKTKVVFYKIKEIAKFIIEDRRRVEPELQELSAIRSLYGGSVL